MLLKRVNIPVCILIIVCSTGFFNLKAGFGSESRRDDWRGMIIALLIIHYTYGDQLIL